MIKSVEVSEIAEMLAYLCIGVQVTELASFDCQSTYSPSYTIVSMKWKEA